MLRLLPQRPLLGDGALAVSSLSNLCEEWLTKGRSGKSPSEGIEGCGKVVGMSLCSEASAHHSVTPSGIAE